MMAVSTTMSMCLKLVENGRIGNGGFPEIWAMSRISSVGAAASGGMSGKCHIALAERPGTREQGVDDDRTTGTSSGSAGEVFAAFLKLGLTSFGGPIAHLGYFRDEFVTRRRWLSDAAYADLVALCQFLPGPASSQTGFALGLMRAGWTGALAAFVAFTLPSALLLVAFALTAASLGGPVADGALHGLKLVAVAIVAQAVLGMAKSLCPDAPRASIAAGAVVLLALLPGAVGMVGAILAGALAGLLLKRGSASTAQAALPVPVPRGVALAALAAFAGLLVALPLLAPLGQGWAVADAFYRAGALVFGGGHVVLPLLEAEVVAPGWVTPDAFLAGYGAAQAVPGPLFTFAAYLGAVLGPAPNGIAGASLALLAIFLPGFLVLIGCLPFWDILRRNAQAQSAMQGANAAVVGILGAALYDPVFTSAVRGLPDLALALGFFVLLVAWKTPPWVVVALGVGLGAALSLG
jgi:chromate transporter